MPGSVSSLDSLHSVSDAGYDSDEEWLLAQQEWEESLAQLQQLVSIVLLPFLGRWMGRKWSFWAYARYVRLGFGKSFFVGARNPLATPTA